MRIVVLGPVRAYADDGAAIGISAARPRMLLARLALAAGEDVSTDSLIEDLWGTNTPADATNALHALVYRLRKAVRGTGTVESVGMGYRLEVPVDHVDAHRFEGLAARGRRELAADAPERAAAVLGEALALWRGAALADVRGAPFADPASARLEELRVAALEDRFDAELQLGHHAEILADLSAAAADHPMRERLAALRMRALYAAGRQSDALAVYEEIRGTLADELGVDPSSEVRETHLAVLRGRLDRPAARSAPVPGRLPAQLTTFIGRDDELKLLAELMDTSRLVTVVGPGGVGKTRLAVEAASRHRSHPRGRLWLVPLAGVDGSPAGSGPGAVVDAVLGVLSSSHGSSSPAAQADPLERVVELLGSGEAVLVLDNCEHVVGPVAEFASRVLERLPSLSILATSREPLEVMGEALHRLGPLGLPPASADTTEARESPAVRLLVDRAAAVRPGFGLDEATVGPVVTLVRGLDGLPLALELAAVRLRSMGIEQVVERLDDRFRLLSTGNRAARPRQRTLHAMIEWSWELLSEQERVLARRMSVFPTGSGAVAIEAVCSDEDALPRDDAGYVLGSLVDKSIVGSAGDGYRMLETIRSYAAEELVAAGERDAVQHRFARYFADLAERHEPLLRTAEQSASLLLFETEYDNLVFALRSAIDAGDASTAARLLAPLCWCWNTLRYDARAETFVARVLELGDALPEDVRAAFAAFQMFTGTGALTSDAERVRALIEDCARTGALRRFPMAMMGTLSAGYLLGLDELVDSEIRTLRGHSDRWAWACTYLVEALARYDRGDWEGMATAMATAVRGFEETGDRVFTAVALSGGAQAHSLRGDHEAAIAAYERSVALAPPDENSYRLGLATERMRAGDLEGARRDLDVVERARRERRQPLLDVEAAVVMADFHRRCGDPDRPDRELDRLLTRATGTSLPEGVIRDLIASARMANRLAAGDTAGARALLPATIRAASAHRDLASTAQQLARLLLLEGDPAGAATALGMGETIRGTADRGDPELRELAAELVGRLGRAEYDRAYREGAQLPRQDALDRLVG